MAIGDFNTCRAYLDEAGAIDATAHYMDTIEQIGFRDLWRHRYPDRREYSWFSTRNNGFRIDHAFLSHELAACAGSVRYSHEERIAGLSDHSPLLVELPANNPSKKRRSASRTQSSNLLPTISKSSVSAVPAPRLVAKVPYGS